MIPSGHSAVMAMRQATDPDTLDYFPTPPWAARAGGELIQKLDPGQWSCWEPAAGEGHMVHGLADYFDRERLFGSDIHPYGVFNVCDFLSDEDAEDWGHFDWIVTNPPFIHAEAFLRTAMRRARRGVALLCRLAFLEGGARYRLMQEFPLTVAAPFAERVPMVKGRWDPAASSATAYAWFIWMKPEIRHSAWLPFGPATGACPALMPIAPGAKARLTRPGDVERFCGKADAPLLGEGTGR